MLNLFNKTRGGGGGKPETFLDVLLRKLRIYKVLPTIKQYPNCKLLDIGCGWNAEFLYSIENYVSEGLGIDYAVQDKDAGKIKTQTVKFADALPYDDNTFDIITMMAVLEHLDFPDKILAEAHRVLKPNGRILLTMPTKAAKPVLEFLSYTLHLIDEPLIREHKAYYTRKNLFPLLQNAGFTIEKHKYFQCGMNNFAIGLKK